MTVLVTGATGTVGRHVVAELSETETTVRAGVRSVEQAREQLPASGSCVHFDFTKPETWGPAFEGIDRLFLVRPPQIGRVHRHITPSIDAAVRMGVEHVALLSVLGAEKNPSLPHRHIERHLESSPVTATFLRASFFMENFITVHRAEIVERDELFLPAGQGATSFVDAGDVAAVGAAALTESNPRSRSYDITGPEALTYEEAAAIFSEVLGRDIEYANPGIIEFLRTKARNGESVVFALVQSVVYTTARLGYAGHVTPDVETVLGRPPTSFRRFVEDNASAFGRE